MIDHKRWKCKTIEGEEQDEDDDDCCSVATSKLHQNQQESGSQKCCKNTNNDYEDFRGVKAAEYRSSISGRQILTLVKQRGLHKTEWTGIQFFLFR